jgi:competence protein ComEA
MLFASLLAYAGLALAAVNINSATREQLESLDGVGPVKAQAIIDYRKKNGPFKTLEDIKKVDGIGDATFSKIRGDLALSGTTTVRKADAKPAAAAEKKADAAKADTKAAVTKDKADTKAAATKDKADTKAASAKDKSDAKAAAAKDKSDAKAATKKDDDKKK